VLGLKHKNDGRGGEGQIFVRGGCKLGVGRSESFEGHSKMEGLQEP